MSIRSFIVAWPLIIIFVFPYNFKLSNGLVENNIIFLYSIIFLDNLSILFYYWQYKLDILFDRYNKQFNVMLGGVRQ